MNVKDLREKLQLTQEGLARKIGVSWGTVSRWERGRVTPSPLAKDKLKRLLKKGLHQENNW